MRSMYSMRPCDAAVCRRRPGTAGRGGRRSHRPAPSLALALVVLASLAAPGQQLAHAEAADDGPAAVDWIRPEEVPARAEALLRRIEAGRIDATAEADLERIESAMARLAPDLDAVMARAAALTRTGSPPELEDVRRELAGVAAPLETWKDELAAEARRVAQTLDEIAGAERVWSETRARPETVAAGEVVLRRIETSLAALEEAAARQKAWRDRVLAASDRVLDRRNAVEVALERVAAELDAPRTSLLIPDRGPLWTRGLGAGIRRELPRAPEAIRAYARSTFAYARQDLRPLALHGLLAALFMLAFRALLARARRGVVGEDLPPRAARLFERPYAIGLVLAFLASPALHPLAPRRFTQLLVVAAFVPMARVVTHVSGRIGAPVFAGVFILLLLDRVALAVAPLPALARTTFLSILVLAVALAVAVSRRLEPARDAAWLRRAARLVVGALVLGLLAEVGGWTYLATLLGRGVIGATLAALYVYAGVIALDAALAYVLRLRPLGRSRLIARDSAALQRYGGRGLRWAGAALWLYFVVGSLGLRTAAATALAALMQAGVSIGAMTLSVGDVVAFVLTLLGVLLLARMVMGLLEEEVFPRANLPRGVPYALSALVRYGVYALGLLFALAAAGVQLSQLSILLGGLGIGIGLGLQDVVKNFAAGLTLLVERRVHVGDAIETPGREVFGRVLAIGMRATVVRNWSGAEVVVPNADLVAGSVTNWTLSDRLCRIDVAVGVAYGSDPEGVLEVLLEAARSVDALIADPPPQALFKGFGESSLDFVLRAWTDEGFERMLPFTSALALAVHARLRDAGVAIPFPQRDLHLVGVSPEARTALAGSGKEE